MHSVGCCTLGATGTVAELRPRVSASTLKRFKECALALNEAQQKRLKRNAASHQIAVLQPPPGLNVELSYSYVTTTNLEEHGKEQKLCQLKLNGAVTEAVLVCQAAQLVCHAKYHRWRNQRLEALVKWFHATHQNVLADDIIERVKAATNQATINVTRSNDNPAVSILGMEHLAVMGKWLIPQQTKALLAKCVVKELPGSMTEAEMYAQRRAAATARSNKDKGVSPEAGKAGEVQASSGLDEAKRPAGGAGAADEKASNSPKMPLFGPMLSPKQPGELTVEETRVQLLDALIAWSDKDLTFQQHLKAQIAEMELKARSLKMGADQLWAQAKGDTTAWQGVDTADVASLGTLLTSGLPSNKKDPYRSYRILLANRELLLAQTESLRRVKGTWGTACDHVGQHRTVILTRDNACPVLLHLTDTLKSTYILAEKMTAGGFALSTAITCKVSGPELPLMMSKAPSPDFMTRFSAAGNPFAILKLPVGDGDYAYELRPERDFPQITGKKMAQFIKLRHIDNFHFSLPKDPPPAPKSAPAAAQPNPGSGTTSHVNKADPTPQPTSSPTATTPETTPGPSTTLTQTPPASAIPDSSAATSTPSSLAADKAATEPGSKLGHNVDNKQDVGAQQAVPASVSSLKAAAEGTPAESDSSQVGEAADGTARPRAGQVGQEGVPEGEELQETSGSVTKAGFEFGGSGQQLKQLVGGLQQYIDSTQRRPLRWTPAEGPFRLQRFVLPRRSPGSGDWHNLQVGAGFSHKEGEPAPEDAGPRSCYITNTHLNGITDCLDELVRQQMGFIQLTDVPPIARPKPRSFAGAVLKAAFKGLSYAALATVIVAPVLAAFRGAPGAYQRQRALSAAPGHALAQTALSAQAQAPAQAEAAAMEAEAGGSIGYEAVNGHMSQPELDALCQKLQDKLRVRPQSRLANPRADVLGRPAVYQIVADSGGEIYGCWPVNDAGVNLWSSLPATAQLRSAKYQQQYQAWLQKVDSPTEEGKSTEIPPPPASAIISKPAPEQPVVLRMSVLIGHDAQAEEARTDLGMLSISDQANDSDEMAKLINLEIDELRQATGGGQALADVEETQGERAMQLQQARAEQEQQRRLQAWSSKMPQGQAVSSATRIVPWTDQDSQLLWT